MRRWTHGARWQGRFILQGPCWGKAALPLHVLSTAQVEVEQQGTRFTVLLPTLELLEHHSYRGHAVYRAVIAAVRLITPGVRYMGRDATTGM